MKQYELTKNHVQEPTSLTLNSEKTRTKKKIMEKTSYNQGHQGPRWRGLAILETEVSIMTTALKRSNVWSRSDAVSAHPTLLKPFIGLRSELNGDSENLDDLDPNVFLAPFLDVIRSDVVTGHVTGLALDAVHKMLSYELLHVDMKEIANAVENIADAVTHARYVGFYDSFNR